MDAPAAMPDLPAPARGAQALPALERGEGAAEIGFAVRGGATRLAHLYQRAPCRVLSPRVAAGEPLQAVMVTTSGGLACGDRLRLALAAGAGTAAQVATQAAEKVYRARGADPARVDCALEAAAGAWLEWLPQETILFDGARLARRTRAEVAPGARLLACEQVVLGRVAMGESFVRGALHDRWEVFRGGRLAWCDALALGDGGADGDADGAAGPRAAPWGLAGAASLATLLYVADDAPARLGDARAILAAALDGAGGDGAEARGAATVVNGVLVARALGTAPAVRAVLSVLVANFRGCAGGFQAAVPRVWTV